MDNALQQLNRLPGVLLPWYDEHRRSLPWRGEVSPYRTWVSEIMLQQTRVAAVIPYFQRFMAAFPTAEALARADTEQLMKLWEGLGYYSRARNLQKAAQIVAQRGSFPDTYEEVMALPGIGDYTAGAILSIAFGQAVPAVDGNVLRVASRLTASEDNILDTKTRSRFRALMAEVIPSDRPGAFNQALMDLGATVCLPSGEPLCDACPARSFCAAYAQGRQKELPVRISKTRRRTEEKTVFLRPAAAAGNRPFGGSVGIPPRRRHAGRVGRRSAAERMGRDASPLDQAAAIPPHLHPYPLGDDRLRGGGTGRGLR